MAVPKEHKAALVVLGFVGWALLLSATAVQQSKVGGKVFNWPVQGIAPQRNGTQLITQPPASVYPTLTYPFPDPKGGFAPPTPFAVKYPTFGGQPLLPLTALAGDLNKDFDPQSAGLSGNNYGVLGTYAYGVNSTSYAWWVTFFEIVTLVLALVAVYAVPDLKLGLVGLLAVLTSTTFLYTQDVYNDTFGIYALTHTTDQAIQIPTKQAFLGSAGVFAYYNSLAVFFAGLLLVDLSNVLLLLTISAEEPKPLEDYKEAAPVPTAA